MEDKEAFKSRLISVPLSGTLKRTDGGFVYLDVSNDVVNGLYRLIDDEGIEKPPYGFGDRTRTGAHVSVISSSELPKKQEVKGLGKEYSFKLGKFYSTKPQGWKEMDRVWFVTVISPELERLRQDNGLTKTYKNLGHDLHITIAVRKKSQKKEIAMSKAAYVRSLAIKSASTLIKMALGEAGSIYVNDKLYSSGNAARGTAGAISMAQGEQAKLNPVSTGQAMARTSPVSPRPAPMAPAPATSPLATPPAAASAPLRNGYSPMNRDMPINRARGLNPVTGQALLPGTNTSDPIASTRQQLNSANAGIVASGGSPATMGQPSRPGSPSIPGSLPSLGSSPIAKAPKPPKGPSQTMGLPGAAAGLDKAGKAAAASIAAGEYLREIPADLLKKGEAYEPLTGIDPELTAFCLSQGGGGRLAWAINERLHGRPYSVEKVASGDNQEFCKVLERGLAFESFLRKMASGISQAVDLGKTITKSASVEDHLVKLAEQVVGTADLGDPRFTRQHGLVDNATFQALTKSAAVRMSGLSEHYGSRETAVLRTARSAFPSVRQEKVAAEVKVDALLRSLPCRQLEVNGTWMPIDTTKQASEALDAAMSYPDDPDFNYKTRMILAKHPEIRRERNIACFQKAGSAALFHNDPYTLGLCILGLAHEGVELCQSK